MAPLFAYFETNPIGHMVAEKIGVTRAMVDKLVGAAGNGDLIVPMSSVTAVELIAARVGAEERGRAVFDLYLRLGSRAHFLKEPSQLIQESIVAFSKGEDDPTPYSPLGEAEVANLELLAGPTVDPETIEYLTSDLRQINADGLKVMTDAWPLAKAEAAKARARGRLPTTVELLDALGPHYLEADVQRAGVLDECRRIGLERLLARPRVRTAVGGKVGLIGRQSLIGFRPDSGDWMDVRHAVFAAASGGVLVTHDWRFSDLVKAIPGAPVEVLTVSELVARL